MNPTHYESISVTSAIVCALPETGYRIRDHLKSSSFLFLGG